MGCPYLEEAMMVFCRAYPVKKLVPRTRITTSNPCLGDGFENCPFFREVMARMNPPGALEDGAPALARAKEERR